MNSVHTGWHRALDVQMDTVKWLRQEYGAIYSYNFFNNLVKGENDDGIFTLIHHLQSTMYQADTIFVTSDMLHLLLQAAHDLPEDVCWDKHALITRRGFVLFEEPIDGTDKNSRNVTIHALAWEYAPTGDGKEAIIIYYLTDPTDFNDEFNEQYVANCARDSVPVPPLVLAHWYPGIVGELLPQVTEQGSEIVIDMIKLFVAMQLLAQQKIGEPIRLRPDRASRKRFHHEHPDEPERLITLITLRRKSIKQDDEEPQKVEWSRRWIVRGFWRRQWFPKSKTHDYVYIHEHIKGPEDKPLIITERRVFNFRR